MVIFLGNNLEKKFFFKMFVHGNVSGCNLVKQMEPNGDLQTTWIMFDHLKCVNKWISLVCHVYDLIYYKMMAIEIYDL
jgi:hypothetical protein